MTTSFGTTTHRPSTNSQCLPPPISQPDEHNNLTHKDHYTISLVCPFDIPSTQESAAIRIVKNLKKFSLYYTIFIWTVLFITLIPKRKVSVVYLVATTEVAFLYVLLLRAVPNSVLLNRIIDSRIVLFFLFVVVCIEMIVTKAAIHLFVTLAATIPVVLLHAVLSKLEDMFTSEENNGEMVRLVEDEHRSDDDQSENIV